MSKESTATIHETEVEGDAVRQDHDVPVSSTRNDDNEKNYLFKSEFNSSARELLGCMVRVFISEVAQSAREMWVPRELEEETCVALTVTKVHTGRIIQRRFNASWQTWEHLVQFKRYRLEL